MSEVLPTYAPFCAVVRDCSCCGATGALACVEPLAHGGVHAFVCRRCGRDPRCS